STADRYVQSVQMSRAEGERSFAFRQAFDVPTAAFVALSDSTVRDLDISTDGRWAVGRDERAYVSDWRPSRADFYRVSTATGERTRMLEGQLTRGATFGISPDGRTFLYWEDEAFHAYDLARDTAIVLGAGAPVFTDTVWDYTGPPPPWGVAGYTADGESVIVEDRYDLWTLPLDGGSATNITGGYGAENRIVLRLVRTEPIDSMAGRAERTGRVYDLSRPVTLSAFGELTKRAGYYRLDGDRLNEVVYEDARFNTPRKAEHADRYLFTRQSFTEPPDLRVSGADFADADRVTDSNPHQAAYRWGRTALIDYEDRSGHPLQGMLWLPDDYREGERRPMLVVFYEKQTQNLNRYPMPELFVSAGRASIEAVSRGYIVLAPDVHYHTGASHTDQLDAVEAATRQAIQLGYADPDRIGLHGHSYAGEGAAYIGTQSELFAAVAAGAGVTDLYTDFSQHWGWSYQNSDGGGANGSGYYMYSQGRWGFSPWERPEVYRSESALSHAHEARQPFLIMHGTADPTVSFNESLKFYNALRFNGKTAWLLAYPGEGHHLSELGNRKDFTTRFYQFFGHHLMDGPAPEWMSRGVPFLEKTGTPAAAAAPVPHRGPPLQ
ncbi:MAG: prolyl oligopeptidase family serine peptidase, partial [Gemmatimonadota bacterium]